MSIDQIDRSASSLSKFENISLQTLKDNGYDMKATGYTLASVSSPAPTRLEAEYSGLTNKECSMFVSSMVNFSDHHSARINNIPITSKASPDQITLECSNGDNNVVIIRENNMFGVALNTSLNGINNPIIASPINPCPTGICSVITVPPSIPFTPISPTINVNKPTFTPAPTPPGPTVKVSVLPQPPTVNVPTLTPPPLVCWNGATVINLRLCPPPPPAPTPPVVTPTPPSSPPVVPAPPPSAGCGSTGYQYLGGPGSCHAQFNAAPRGSGFTGSIVHVTHMGGASHFVPTNIGVNAICSNGTWIVQSFSCDGYVQDAGGA